MQTTGRFSLHAVPLLFVAAACSSTGARSAEGRDDPAQGAVRLAAHPGWDAVLALDTAPAGIWTVAALDVFPQYAGAEVVGLDDLGRCHVLVSYSGRWTPFTAVADGEWLGGLAHGDVDPRVPGSELYTGGKSGNLYQIRVHREGQGVLEARRVAYLAGREIHTLVASRLRPELPGDQLLAFTAPGELYLVMPQSAGTGFDVELLGKLDGRIRDALVLPADSGPAQVATASRAGRIEILQFDYGGPLWTTVHELPVGRGRLALKPAAEGEPTVLYSTSDDGGIWRHARSGETWETELVYAGPVGPRGLAAGRFDDDPAVECLAVFGYDARVELLTRVATGWHVETIFTDRDKGHWLAAGEFDRRNGTDELLASGYGARIVMLARPPGYGLPRVLVVPPR